MTKAELTIEDEAADFWAKYFCNCGDPRKALEAFREIMGLFARRAESEGEYVVLSKWEDYASRHGKGLAYCILYWLEGMGLTEHGTGTIGSWLTPLGEHVKKEIADGTPEFFREDQ